MLLTTIFQHPGSEGSAAVALKLDGKARGTGTVWRRRRGRADDPARRGGGSVRGLSATQQQGKRAAARRREREPSCRDEINGVIAAHLGDHHADGAAAQRLLHRP